MARKRDNEQQDLDNRAALTGHTTKPHVTEDENGKVQSIHTTTVITDPDSPLAVQGHDDPRVNGSLADPLRRSPSPNEIAEGAEVPEDDAASHVNVSGTSDEDAAAGRLTDESQAAAKDND